MAGRKAANELEPDIRQRLLDAGHEVLAEQGLGGFKVVDVANRARANVAMINYHFGGRDGLLDEVILLAGERIGRHRRKALLEVMAHHAPSVPQAEEILQCWLTPLYEALNRSGEREVMLAMVHLMFAADAHESRKIAVLQGVLDVTKEFVDALEKCLPEVGREAIAWRMMCAVGSCYLVLTQRSPIGWSTLAGSASTRTEERTQMAMDQLTSFIVAGMRSPAKVPTQSDHRVTAKRPRRK